MDVPSISDIEVFARLGLAILCGALVGLEREWRDRAAGLRTHTLVALGSTMFTLLSLYGMNEWVEYSVEAAGNRPLYTSDPGRIAAQIVAGIGFIGAGAIWRSRTSVQGVTTAASLWMMAAIGMAIGMGWYWPSVACTAAIIIVLMGLRMVSTRLLSHESEDAEHEIEMRMTLSRRSDAQGVLSYFAGEKFHLKRTRVYRDQGHNVLLVTFSADRDRQAQVVGACAEMDAVQDVELNVE